MSEITQKEAAECYQPLFDLLSNEYGLTLLVSEMDEIIKSSLMVVENVNKHVAKND